MFKTSCRTRDYVDISHLEKHNTCQHCLIDSVEQCVMFRLFSLQCRRLFWCRDLCRRRFPGQHPRRLVGSVVTAPCFEKVGSRLVKGKKLGSVPAFSVVCGRKEATLMWACLLTNIFGPSNRIITGPVFHHGILLLFVLNLAVADFDMTVTHTYKHTHTHTHTHKQSHAHSLKTQVTLQDVILPSI
jgi:hypothetical protein